MKTLKLLIKRVSLIKSMILCASTLSNKSLIEEAKKCLFRTSSRSPVKMLTAKMSSTKRRMSANLKRCWSTDKNKTAKSQFTKSVDLKGNYCARDKKNQRYYSTNVNYR